MKPEDYLKKIQSTTSLDNLQKTYASIISEVRHDKALMQAVISEKDKMKIMFDDRKAEIENESKNNEQ